MSRFTRSLFTAAALLTLSSSAQACKSEAAPKAPAQAVKTAAAPAKTETKPAPEAKPAPKAPVKKVVVPKEGKKFDPPVEKAAIPDGAYICDMGTVHYARLDKGDGRCPLCHMHLKHMENGKAVPLK